MAQRLLLGKRLDYHGIQFHCLGFDTCQHLTVPEIMYFTTASANNLTRLKTTISSFSESKVIENIRFAFYPINTDVSALRAEIVISVELKEGQKYLQAADILFSYYISSLCRPFGFFVQWLIKKTSKQTDGKVHSEKGFGYMAMA